MRSRKFSLIAFALITSMIVPIMMPLMMPLAFADAPKYEKVLKIVSGSQSDLTTFTYNGHVVSEGFAVSASIMAPVEPNVAHFTKVAFAVSLGSGWGSGFPSARREKAILSLPLIYLSQSRQSINTLLIGLLFLVVKKGSPSKWILMATTCLS